MLPCLVILLLFAAFGCYSMKSYYDEIVNATGLGYKDFEKEFKKENERALKDQEEYQRIIAEEYGQEDAAGEENDRADTAPEQDLSLHARSALLLDASNNRVLYEENGHDRMSMASTTKIMTCIVALENADLNGIVTVSSYAAGMPDVQLNINKGDEFYLKDLLYSLMLESHNDVAVAIAEYVGGSVDGFATMMNDKARTLECYDTNFITPNGLDAEGHYTTARDLAVIASYAIKNELFLEITNTSSYSFQEIKKGKKYSVTNKNRFLYMMEGAIGVKTGFTGDAGYCFVGAVKRIDRTLVSVVLGCGWPPNKNLKWSDTKELMAYGVNNYKEKQIFQDIDLAPVFVKDGQQKYEMLHMEGDLTLLLRDDETIKIEYDLPKSLAAPVKANNIVGTARYYIGDMLYAEIPIYTTQDISKIDFFFCLKEISRLWSLQY
jgi:D-alanyl-D-alanine carboxypeptidase (penicillin-binding protein 5/6)